MRQMAGNCEKNERKTNPRKMPTLAELHQVDCLGFAKIDAKQLKAMVDMLKRTGKLDCPPPPCHGQGVIIAGGGKYLSWSWVLVSWLRRLGCTLPVQVWHLGGDEMPAWAIPHFENQNAETVDVTDWLKVHPHRMLSRYIAEKKWTLAGWCLKMFALEHCPWEQVYFSDADSFPTENPESVMNSSEVKASGILAFSDVANHAKNSWGYVYAGLKPLKKEWELGQYIVNRRIGWMGLRWSNWMNEHADSWFGLGHGDKFTGELAFRVSGVPLLVSEECSWEGWGILHKWKGRDFAMHCMGTKRGEYGFPRPEIQELFWDWERRSRGKS